MNVLKRLVFNAAFAMAFSSMAFAQNQNGCNPSGNTPKKCGVSVSEPAANAVSVFEPATLGLFGIGILVGVIAHRRKK